MNDQPDTEQPEPLDTLNEAVQSFVNTQVHRPTLVDQAVVIWEEVSYDETGTTQRRIRYSIPTDNFSLGGALGLLEAAREYVRRDILGARNDQEADDD